MTRNPGMLARWRARRAYFAADAEARQAYADLADSDPAARREALLWAADCERTMSATAAGFRDADQTDKDGYTLAQSHEFAALLLTMIADTEHDPGNPWRYARQYPRNPWRQIRRSYLDDDPAVINVLVMLAEATDVRTRAVLTLTLYDVVVSRVGGQAAEVLATGVAYSYYRLAGLSHEHASYLTGPNAAGWER